MTILQLMMHRNGVVNHTVAISPDPVTGVSTTPTPASANATANVTSGVGPFTYAWSWDSGGTGITITNSTSATCTITTSTGLTGLRTGVLKCDVTDTGNGSYVASDTVTAELEVEV
jgi:hypothetical protein